MASFYKCPICGNIIGLVEGDAKHILCCGKPMQELIANSTDAAGEKHVPVVHEEGNKVYVQVGEVAHPMTEEHYIQWVYLLTDKGVQRKILKPGQEPKVIFTIGEDEIVLDCKAYCNLHGLWQAKID